MSLGYEAKMKARAAAERLSRSVPVEKMMSVAGRQVLTCIGDSHLEPLLTEGARQSLPHTTLRVTSVGGATGSGITNPNSQTQALPRFLAATRYLHKGSALLACLGEVDAGFLVFMQAERDGQAAKEHADTSLSRYQQFLTDEVLARGARLLMVSVVPPLIEDYADWEGLRGQRRDIRATWAERADMTAYWNDSCAQWCATVGAAWLDLTPEVVDPQTGRARAKFVNANHDDHHLDQSRHVDLLVGLLRRHGFS